jgi:hypothetical protein
MYYLVTQRPGGSREFVHYKSGLPTQFQTVKSAREKITPALLAEAGYLAGSRAWAVKEAGEQGHEIIGESAQWPPVKGK